VLASCFLYIVRLLPSVLKQIECSTFFKVFFISFLPPIQRRNWRKKKCYHFYFFYSRIVVYSLVVVRLEKCTSFFSYAPQKYYVHREEEKVRKIVHISNATGVNSDRHSKAPATSTRPIISQARKAELWNYSCEIAAFMCLDRRNAGILQARTHTHTHKRTHSFCPVLFLSSLQSAHIYLSLSGSFPLFAIHPWFLLSHRMEWRWGQQCYIYSQTVDGLWTESRKSWRRETRVIQDRRAKEWRRIEDRLGCADWIHSNGNWRGVGWIVVDVVVCHQMGWRA
jgi:hypothetical protein